MPWGHQPYIIAYPMNTQGSGQYRLFYPARALEAAGHALVRVDSRLVSPEGMEILRPDALWWQQQLSDQHYEYLKEIKRITKAFTLYDFDDLITNIPDANPHKGAFPQSTAQRLRRWMVQFDQVTVSTEPLAAMYRSIRSDIQVVPLRMPRELLEQLAVVERPVTGKPKIGWAGGVSHVGDLAIVPEIMKILGDEVEWAFLGMRPPGAEDLPHTFVPPTPFGAHLHAMNNMGLDLALAPLERNSYNRCKSNLRILENGACAYPVLATDIDPYTDCPVFFPKDDSPEAWAAAIRELVADREALRRAGNDLKNWVWRHHTLEDDLSARLRSFTIETRPVLDKGVFWSSPTHMADEALKGRLEQAAKDGGPAVGAVCCWSNDGEFMGYPQAGAFTPINDTIHAHMNDAAGVAFKDETPPPLPFPVGPIVYVTPEALAAVGGLDPNISLRAGQLMDFGARLRKAGFEIRADLKSFCGVWAPLPRETALAQSDFNCLVNRHPGLQDDVRSVVQSAALAEYRERLEAEYLGQHYPILPPSKESGVDAYDFWRRMFDHCPTVGSGVFFRVRVLEDAEPSETLKASLSAQTYSHHNLYTDHEAPDGAPVYILYVHATDELHKDALARLNTVFVANDASVLGAEALVLYGDHDFRVNNVLANPQFKGEFNYEEMLASNAIGTGAAVREELTPEGPIDEAQYHDLLLRAYEKGGAGAFVHTPFVTVHRTARPIPLPRIHEHLQRTKQAAMITPTPLGYLNVQFSLPADAQPLVSIIIPTKPTAALLAKCLRSLEKTTYPHYEVLVVVTGSPDKDARRLLGSLAGHPKIRVLHDMATPFNYSRVNNAAVARAKGEYVCLLNDDTEVVTPHWLDIMVRTAHREGVGAVGAKLLYKDGRVQHVGVVTGMPLIADHKMKLTGGQDPGYAGQSVIMHEVTAVTGACLLVKKALYQEIGGLDESLRIAYNDVLFCLKLRQQGYRNVMQPNAVLIHHESVSRGLDDTPEKMERHLQEAAAVKAAVSLHDPFWSPNLALTPQPSLAWPPRQVHTPDAGGIVLVNAPPARRYADMEKFRVFSLDTHDHEHLRLSYPPGAAHRPLSIRSPYADWARLFAAWRVQRVEVFALNGLGVEGLGLLARLHREGVVQVAYVGGPIPPLCPRETGTTPSGACGEGWLAAGVTGCELCIERHGSAHGYVDVVAWRRAWGAFLDATAD